MNEFLKKTSVSLLQNNSSSKKMENYLATFSQREELLRRVEREEELKRQQEREALVRDIVSATASNKAPESQINQNELLEKIARLEKELASTKSQTELYARDRPQISELIIEKQTKEEAQMAFATMFIQRRIRQNPTATIIVSVLNLELEKAGEKYGVRFGYHDHSRALKAAGLPEPIRSNSQYYYQGVELQVESKTISPQNSPQGSPQMNLSPPGSPSSMSPPAPAFSPVLLNSYNKK